MKICIFKTNELFTQFENIHARIDVIPEFSKTKMFKFLLDIDDIEVIAGNSFNSNNCLQVQKI